MKISPKGPWVLVEVTPVETKSSGGIALPTDFVKKEQGGRDIGKIVAFGPVAYKDLEGCSTPEEWGVKIGDFVEFRRYDGKVPRLAEDNEEMQNLRLILDRDIIAGMEE